MPTLSTPATARGIASLIKPRIAALLCLTGAAGALAAGGIPAVELAAFLVAGAGMAGGAAACNCYYDRDLDRLMERTADRPLPSGELAPWVALVVAAALLAGGTAVAWAALPPSSVAYMWLGVASYVGLYTVGLKRRHWSGVVLGGSAGAFPVLAGWTAADPGLWPVAPGAVLMAAVVFAWTPAHAWALADVYRDDFAAAGIPTLPVIAAGPRVRRAVWRSALATVALAAATVAFAGPLYAGVLLGATGPFLLSYRRYRRDGTDRAAVRAFFTSNCFLALISLAWGIDGLLDPGIGAGVIGALAAPLAFAWLWRHGPALRGIEGGVAFDASATVPRRLRAGIGLVVDAAGRNAEQ